MSLRCFSAKIFFAARQGARTAAAGHPSRLAAEGGSRSYAWRGRHLFAPLPIRRARARAPSTRCAQRPVAGRVPRPKKFLRLVTRARNTVWERYAGRAKICFVQDLYARLISFAKNRPPVVESNGRRKRPHARAACLRGADASPVSSSAAPAAGAPGTRNDALPRPRARAPTRDPAPIRRCPARPCQCAVR